MTETGTPSQSSSSVGVSAVDRKLPHICVCVCTYKRPELLKRLLQEVARQETDGMFTFSAVVVDNDAAGSAESIVSEAGAAGGLTTNYAIEPCQNIALARNRAVAEAMGDYVAFIDDDEFPVQRWLVTLFRACQEYGVDGVLGPVHRHFDVTPPAWVSKSDLYKRPSYPTGLVIDWRKGRTGNVLLKKEVFSTFDQPFRPEFRQGEDQDFFHRAIESGRKFIWCHEAVAYEVVPPIRWNRKFLLKRALLRGAMEPQTPGFGVRDVLTSIVAVGVYTVALPFMFVVGQHRFMKMLISMFDHLGKLFAVIGFKPIKDPYVTG